MTTDADLRQVRMAAAHQLAGASLWVQEPSEGAQELHGDESPERFRLGRVHSLFNHEAHNRPDENAAKINAAKPIGGPLEVPNLRLHLLRCFLVQLAALNDVPPEFLELPFDRAALLVIERSVDCTCSWGAKQLSLLRGDGPDVGRLVLKGNNGEPALHQGLFFSSVLDGFEASAH